MKKSVIVIALVLSLYVLAFVSAESCSLEVSLINQDPYPASPGDYVELVFQMTGTDNLECLGANFELIEDFPFSVVEGSATRVLEAPTYVRNFQTAWMIPYKLLIDKNAIDKNYEVKVMYSSKKVSNNSVEKKFNVKVEDANADFDIHIKNYDYTTKELSFEILNIAKNDAEAITLEVPKQQNIEVRGSNIVIVGDIDSNEYTNADFKADILDGEITLDLYYTDAIGERRSIEKTVIYDSSYFAIREDEKPKTPTWYYVVGGLVIILVIWMIFRKHKKKKLREMKRRGMAKL